MTPTELLDNHDKASAVISTTTTTQTRTQEHWLFEFVPLQFGPGEPGFRDVLPVDVPESVDCSVFIPADIVRRTMGEPLSNPYHFNWGHEFTTDLLFLGYAAEWMVRWGHSLQPWRLDFIDIET